MPGHPFWRCVRTHTKRTPKCGDCSDSVNDWMKRTQKLSEEVDETVRKIMEWKPHPTICLCGKKTTSKCTTCTHPVCASCGDKCKNYCAYYENAMKTAQPSCGHNRSDKSSLCIECGFFVARCDNAECPHYCICQSGADADVWLAASCASADVRIPTEAWLYETQIAIGANLFERCNKFDFSCYTDVKFVFCSPPQNSLKGQTVLRLKQTQDKRRRSC